MNKPLLHIFVCTNMRDEQSGLPSCGAGGSETLLEAFRTVIARYGLSSTVKVTASGCLTPCQYGPNVVIYPEAVWYSNVQPSDAAEIVDVHIQRAPPIQRLLLPKSDRLL